MVNIRKLLFQKHPFSTPYLVNIVSINGGIKNRIKIVEQIHHLDWSTMGSYRCKTNDVTEVDGHIREFFWFNSQPHF